MCFIFLVIPVASAFIIVAQRVAVYHGFFGVQQMQTADLQTRTWVSQTSTSVSQTTCSTPVSQNSTSVRLFRLAISDGNSNTIYNLQVCSLHMSHTAVSLV